MFCPKCKDEFRAGFTRCGRCNVDLVEKIQKEPPPGAGPGAGQGGASCGPVRMGEYCGFLSLDEARHARGQLRERQIRTEIVLREPADASWSDPLREEYWLRVDVSRVREVAGTLCDIPQTEEAEAAGESFACGDCGHEVSEEESFCPKCGARFDD